MHIILTRYLSARPSHTTILPVEKINRWSAYEQFWDLILSPSLKAPAVQNNIFIGTLFQRVPARLYALLPTVSVFDSLALVLRQLHTCSN